MYALERDQVQEVPMFRSPVPSVDPTGVPADAVMLDVREPGEWQAGHIEGALHIPLADLPSRLAELPGDADLVVVCRSGARSARAVTWLTSNGYHAVNLDGGMGAWAAVGREMVSDTGEAPKVR
jgi:rhodanese-related sulfurtransferase